MIIAISEPVKILKVEDPRTFVDEKGDSHESYSCLVADGIYPMRIRCDKAVHSQLKEDETYSFVFEVRLFKGRYSVKATGIQ